MSPLGVAKWKIEFSPRSAPLPQTVTQRMSPLGVAHWKSKLVPKIKCPPPWLKAKKIHLLRKWFFLASGQGGGQIIIKMSDNIKCGYKIYHPLFSTGIFSVFRDEYQVKIKYPNHNLLFTWVSLPSSRLTWFLTELSPYIQNPHQVWRSVKILIHQEIII